MRVSSALYVLASKQCQQDMIIRFSACSGTGSSILPLVALVMSSHC